MEQMTSRSFQSPRRWGGVGRLRAGVSHRYRATRVSFQSPRRWGGVGLFMSRPSMTPRSIALFRFNPLGGGAGSGWLSTATGSRPRWTGFIPLGGGAGSGLVVTADCKGVPLGFVSIPSEVGRGRNTSCRDEIIPILSFVSIPSEVGRGRAGDPETRSATCVAEFRFNPLGGGAGSGSQRTGRHQRG